MVARVICEFKASKHGDLGIEDILARLQSPNPESVNPRKPRSVALQTVRLVESIRDQERGTWQQQADATRQAALELAAAAEAGNEKSLAVAGRKLRMACAECHATYRSWRVELFELLAANTLADRASTMPSAR